MTNGKVTLGVGEVDEDSIVVVGVSSTPPADVAVEEGYQVNGFRVVVVISAKTYEGVFVIQRGPDTEYPRTRPCGIDLLVVMSKLQYTESIFLFHMWFCYIFVVDSFQFSRYVFIGISTLWLGSKKQET